MQHTTHAIFKYKIFEQAAYEYSYSFNWKYNIKWGKNVTIKLQHTNLYLIYNVSINWFLHQSQNNIHAYKYYLWS